MRSYVIERYGNVGDIKIIDRDRPEPKNHEVLIKVKASSVNPADLKVITGKNGGKMIHSSRFPVAIGFDFSGVIKETGKDVSEFNSGDEVFGFLPYSRKTTQGSFSELLVVDRDSIARKPSSVSHIETATAATTASTALQALGDGVKLEKGKKIFINGASGGVGSYAVQIAKNHKMNIWGTAGSSNLNYIKSKGVEIPMDYRDFDPGDMEEKFDTIFDVASTMSFHKCKKILSEEGVYITLMPSPSFFTGKIRTLLSKQQCNLCIVKPERPTLESVADMLGIGSISAPVTATYSIKELKKALERFEKGGVKGKIGIVMDW